MSECESDYLVRNLRLQEELSALRKELEEAKEQNRLCKFGWYENVKALKNSIYE